MNIIFVCTGNTCRSPLAESIAHSLMPQYHIESRGLFAFNGQSPSSHVLEIIEDHNLPMPSNSQSFENEDLAADLILTMSKDHKMLLQQQYGQQPHVFTLSEYVGETDDIEDPFGGSKDTYNDTYHQLVTLLTKLNDKINE